MFFFIFVFSRTSFVYTLKEITFFQSYTTNKGKIFCSQNGSQFAVFRCYQKPRLIWT